MTALQFESHVRYLALEHDVRVIETAIIKPHEACGLLHIRVILIHPIVDDTTYAVALHEMGHLCSLCKDFRFNAGPYVDTRRVMLLEEEAAWDWAKDHALEWTTPMMSLHEYALATYRRFGGIP